MDNLKRYNFKDDHGHPLENCQDYIDLLKRIETAESSLAAMRQRSERAEYCLRHIQRLTDASTMGGEAVSKMENAEMRRQYRPLEPEPWGGPEGEE